MKANRKKKLSPTYWIALLLVSTVLAGLVSFYVLFLLLLILVSLAYAIATPILIFLNITSAQGLVFGAIAYVIGLIFFLTLLLLAVTTLFRSRRATASADMKLDREKYQELYAFVSRIAREIGAPEPRAILVSMEINAGAAFAGGLFNFMSRRMELMLGLPIVEVMSQRELAEIIAHELGHFSQGAGMRLSYMVRTINAHFDRIVFEKDGWDEWLKTSADDWGALALIPMAALASRVIFRFVLFPITLISHVISMHLLREMEYDADQYSAIVAGKETFEDNFRLMYILEMANAHAFGEVRRLWREQEKAVESYTELIEASIEKLDPESLKGLEAMLAQEKAGFFDTHPSTKQRIARIKNVEGEGLDFEEDEAKNLIPDYETLARGLTRELYKNLLGSDYEKAGMTKVSEVQETRKKEEFRSQVLDRYFQTLYSYPLLPITVRIPPLTPPDDANTLLQRIKEARQNLMAASSEVRGSLKTYARCSREAFRAEACIVLIRSELKVSASVKNNKLHKRNTAEVYLREQNIERNSAQSFLRDFEGQNQERFIAALRLSLLPDVKTRLKEKGVSVDNLQTLIDNLESVSFVMDMVRELGGRVAILSLLLRHLGEASENRALIQRIHDYVRMVHQQMQAIMTPLDYHKYPFEHSAGQITMAQYALPELPHPYDLEAVFHAAERMISNIHHLYFQVFGTLAEVAESVEETYGLERLPEPQREELDEEEEASTD